MDFHPISNERAPKRRRMVEEDPEATSFNAEPSILFPDTITTGFSHAHNTTGGLDTFGSQPSLNFTRPYPDTYGDIDFSEYTPSTIPSNAINHPGTLRARYSHAQYASFQHGIQSGPFAGPWDQSRQGLFMQNCSYSPGNRWPVQISDYLGPYGGAHAGVSGPIHEQYLQHYISSEGTNRLSVYQGTTFSQSVDTVSEPWSAEGIIEDKGVETAVQTASNLGNPLFDIEDQEQESKRMVCFGMVVMIPHTDSCPALLN